MEPSKANTVRMVKNSSLGTSRKTLQFFRACSGLRKTCIFDQRKWFKFITKCDGIITNCDTLVYYKARWTVITNCVSFFYKERHGLLQVATGITKCDEFITNCDRYYKVLWLLQIATVQQHTFFVNFFAVVFHDYNAKLPETFLWTKCRTRPHSLFFSLPLIQSPCIGGR